MPWPLAAWILSACTSISPTPDDSPTVPATDPPPAVAINELCPSDSAAFVDADGSTPDWIELVNTSEVAANLRGWTLSDDPDVPAKWTFPDVVLAGGDHLLVLASGDGEDAPTSAGPELRTNFQLDADGETVTLSDPSGAEIDRAEPQALAADQSFGRTPDAGGTWGYFLSPTPGAANTTEARPGFAAAPSIDPPGGFYTGGVNVTFHADAPSQVRFTEDGRDPADSDPVAPDPLVIATGTDAVVVRGRTFSDKLWPSAITTATYLTRAPGTMPIVSLTTDPANLWDEETGIYTFGDSYDTDLPYFGANFWEDWEKPVHVEEWEPDGAQGFAVDATLSIHGGWTRAFAQKSFDVKLDLDGGDKSIDDAIFPELPIDSYDRILLRNAGNDWHGCFTGGCNTGAHLRDALVQSIAADQGLDAMAYRPTEVYLNGDWFGLYELREKPDGSYVEEHYGAKDVDLLELGIPLEGDTTSWDATMDFLRTHDLADPANWSTVEGSIDVDELATWLAVELWADNTDWPGNNVRWWRPREDGAKWRWFLYDTDYGLGAYFADPNHDTLAMALADDGPIWPNPPWSTELFRLLFTSPQFVDIFCARYADLLNTAFDPSVTTARLDAMSGAIADLIPRQEGRWGVWTDGVTTLTMPSDAWDGEIAWMHEWLEARTPFARQHVVDDLGLAGTFTLTLAADPPGSGTFALTAATVSDGFTGTYFQGIPVTITALPADGHSFLGWTGPVPQTATVTVDSTGEPVDLVARFQ